MRLPTFKSDPTEISLKLHWPRHYLHYPPHHHIACYIIRERENNHTIPLQTNKWRTGPMSRLALPRICTW